MNMMERFENWNKSLWVIIGFTLIAGLGLLDYVTGHEVSFSLFYLLPISLIVWFTGQKIGIVASIVCAIVWLIADVLSGQHYSHAIIFLWNSAIRFGFFIIVTSLLAALKKTLEHEKVLSRIDRLTGATSGDFFFVLLQAEIKRFQRYKNPFSVAYIDLDNFKTINDQFGHSMGDTVLRSVIDLAKQELRKTDIISRLGGDEFAILFPETDQLSAKAAVSRIHKGLLDEMERSNWPVTFSIGAMTFVDTPSTANELIKLADNLMYQAKNSGKNSILYSVYSG